MTSPFIWRKRRDDAAPFPLKQEIPMHDPGGKIRLPMEKGVTGGAEFSPCGRYRRMLWRQWGSSGSTVLFIGMNPSTADAEVDDPTIRREIGFARRLGAARLVKCNIGDYRATNPKDLLPLLTVEACTLANVAEISLQVRAADMIVMAHGVPPAPLLQPAREIAALITRIDRPMFCLGLTKDGWPRHPLYAPRSAPLIRYQR
jgi:hypothetical protein